MAVVRPLILDANNDLVEMSDAQISAIKDRCRYLYGNNPSSTLAVQANSGNMGTLTDTRKTAGAHIARVDRYALETETAEPGTASVGYARLNSAQSTVGATADTNNRRFPCYATAAGDIQAMSITDLNDTFIHPAISTLVSAVGQPGTYRIHTSTTLAGCTLISTTPVFSDTRANTGLYTAAGIGETLDQPFTVTSYYLFRVNSIAEPAIEKMVRILDTSFDIQEFTNTEIDTILSNSIRNQGSAKIRYNIDGVGVNLGSTMSNTILNGSGAYNIRFVNANDYRAQEFPNGSAVTPNSYNLRMTQI